MFRKLLLSTAFLYSSVAVMAQPVFIDSVENNNIGGPCRIGDGMEMYTYFIKGAENSRLKSAKLIVNVTGAGQQMSKGIAVDIDKNTNILSTAANNMGAVFLTYNTASKAAALMSIDFAGNIIKKITVEGIGAEQAVWDNDIHLYPMMMEGYLLVLPDAKKNGYTITAYSTDLNELWKEKYESRHNSMEIAGAKMVGESLFLLRKELVDAKQQKNIYSLQVLNTQNHSNNTVHELKDKNNNYCYASAINEQDAFIQIAGVCYKDGKFAQGLPAGVAVYEFEMNGNLANSVFADGQQLGKFLPDAIIAAMATNSTLHITGVVSDNMQNAYGLIGELVEKNFDAKQKEAKIVVSDMMTMIVNKEGELQKMTLADRSPRMAISLKGGPAGADAYSIASWLQRNKLFNAKFTMRLGDGYYICTKATDTAKNEIDARFIKIDEPTSENQFSMAIGRTPSNDIGMKPVAKLNIVAGTTDNKVKRWMHADVYNTMGTQAVFYNQADDKIVLYYDAVMKRNEK